MSNPAGWFQQDDGQQRYWDGEQWTEHFAPGTLPATSAANVSTGTPARVPLQKKHVIGYAVTALLGLGIGLAFAGSPEAITTSAASDAARPAITVKVPGPATTVTVPGPVRTVTVPGPVKRVAVTATVTVTVTKAAPKPAAAPQAAGSTTIEDGQWEVGVDVAAGVYKVTAAVDPDALCYWSITETGKPDNIIDNDIVKGGKPTVTLKRGQDFTTNDCGTWARR
jgi:hypothetical protein